MNYHFEFRRASHPIALLFSGKAEESEESESEKEEKSKKKKGKGKKKKVSSMHLPLGNVLICVRIIIHPVLGEIPLTRDRIRQPGGFCDGSGSTRCDGQVQSNTGPERGG